MTKQLVFGLLLVAALVIAACAPATAPGAAPAPAATEAAGGEQAAAPSGEQVTLTIESWRNDDLPIWQDVIIPAFEAKYPNIKVNFAPAAPAEYNAVLNSKLEAGTAGDLITCRPFDASLALYQGGKLANLTDLPGMENFGDVAKSAWITDDGKEVFCVPMASVIHGFLYNKAIFDELGLAEPTTEAEFYAVLDAIKAAGKYALDMGTKDQWESATMGFQNIGPNYWKGEDGRKALIAGTEKFTDPQYVAVWDQLKKWGPYLPDGYEAQSYPDSQNLFINEQAAIYPAGSWDIAFFQSQNPDLQMGAFKPPLPEGADKCYISDHVDIALGLNAASSNADAAKTFLSWVASPEFGELYSNSLPGFYSLNNTPVEVKNELAKEFVDWRNECGTTIRNSYQILSRGEPNLENELWRVSAEVMNQTLEPADAAQQIQDGLDKWYKPAQ
jgi:raffinose/stachyose/melibiose transport system substrate-binding protein